MLRFTLMRSGAERASMCLRGMQQGRLVRECKEGMKDGLLMNLSLNRSVPSERER